MDFPKVALDELIERLKELLRGHGLREAHVFGSRVRGDYLHRSDLDVIVVDDRYAGVPFLQRGLDLLAEWPGSLPELELFCYTPAEFARGNTVIREATKYGLHVVLDDEPTPTSPHASG